jgi:tRNA dimethylallyltransferase
VVIGPTGIGKTELAVRLAERLGGEIVVADSRQVYRDLHIATNHPSPDQRARARFHLIEVADPSQSYTVHEFVLAARVVVADILGRGRLPIVEGGTGLYVDALMDGYDFAGVEPDAGRRVALEALPREELVAILQDMDPNTNVDLNNPRRLIRAIELRESAGASRFAESGATMGEGVANGLAGRVPVPWEGVRIGLTAPRPVIWARLQDRVKAQIEAGVVEETAAALAAGIPVSAPVLTGIGYRDSLRLLSGTITAADLPEAMLVSNRQYARRQLTWWRRDHRVHWFPAEPDPLPGILEYFAELDLGGILKEKQS